MLHTVNKSPFGSNSLETCLKMATSGSTVLLIEDGVYAALKDSSVAETIAQAMGTVTIAALAPDLAARGVADKVMDGIKLVDYSGFVDLVCETDKTTAWL